MKAIIISTIYGLQTYNLGHIYETLGTKKGEGGEEGCSETINRHFSSEFIPLVTPQPPT